MNFKIFVLGAGYVGLTTALGFAKKGFNVSCIDNDRSRINKLLKGKVPFAEPFLKENLSNLLKKKKIEFKNKLFPKDFLNVVFICVGTPVNKSGEFQIKNIENLVKNFSRQKNYKFLIVIKSTVFPGTYKKKIKKFK